MRLRKPCRQVEANTANPPRGSDPAAAASRAPPGHGLSPSQDLRQCPVQAQKSAVGSWPADRPPGRHRPPDHPRPASAPAQRLRLPAIGSKGNSRSGARRPAPAVRRCTRAHCARTPAAGSATGQTGRPAFPHPAIGRWAGRSAPDHHPTIRARDHCGSRTSSAHRRPMASSGSRPTTPPRWHGRREEPHRSG